MPKAPAGIKMPKPAVKAPKISTPSVGIKTPKSAPVVPSPMGGMTGMNTPGRKPRGGGMGGC